MTTEAPVISMNTHESWSIYSVCSTEKGLFGKDYYHSFLMLVNETNGKTLKELHFSSLSADGRKEVRSLRHPLNVMAATADKFKLLSAFKKAADKIGVGKNLIRIKGVQTSGRHELQDVAKSRLCFKGSPAQAMSLWNTACREAIALNKTDTPFILVGLGKPGVNCQAGTEMVLESMGLSSGAAMAKHEKMGFGRHLRSEIKGLDEIHHNGGDSSLENLLQENAKLATAIYSTRPQARYRQRQKRPA